jgi:hypothetical protein
MSYELKRPSDDPDDIAPSFQRALMDALLELTDTQAGSIPKPLTLGYRLKDVRDKKIGGFHIERGPKGNGGITYRLVADEAARLAMLTPCFLVDRLRSTGDETSADDQPPS